MPSVVWKNTIYKTLLPLWGFRLNEAPFSSTHSPNDKTTLQKVFKKNHVVGGSFLTFEKNMFTGLSTYGFQRLYDLPVTDSTIFRCASISKLVLALGALILVEEGKIGLDDDLCGYFTPPLVNPLYKNKPITLYQLLNHTSSLVDGPAYAKSLNCALPLEEILSQADSYGNWEPDSIFSYSNMAFGLIGSLIEKITHTSLESFMKDKVFTPLEMNCTFDITAAKPVSAISANYRVLSKKPGKALLSFDPIPKVAASTPITYADPSFHYHHGAGSLYSDVFSLGKILSLFAREGAPLLSKNTFKEMIAPSTPYGKEKSTFFHGLGVAKVKDPSLSPNILMGHQGFAYGVAQGIFYDPVLENGFVSLNSGCSLYRKNNLSSLSYDLISAFLSN